MPKFLVIRFSSIGDIVLTTPVVRCLAQQVDGAEVHYLTKKSFQSVVADNPYIRKQFYLDNNEKELIESLRKENYDAVIDLHHNIRTARFGKALGKTIFRFHKLNIEKWLMVNFKVNRLPDTHIVDRYLETVESFGVKNDGEGLDYFIGEKGEVSTTTLPEVFSNGYNALVIGGTFPTKAIPVEKAIEIIQKLDKPVVLLGGPDDVGNGRQIEEKCTGYKLYNAVGKYTLNQSASLVKQSDVVITGDTGLMHIAAAFKKKIISVWGNTIPEFGMYPYLPKEKENLSIVLENKSLSCRPCSKLGHTSCPKKHFKCMLELDTDKVSEIASKKE